VRLYKIQVGFENCWLCKYCQQTNYLMTKNISDSNFYAENQIFVRFDRAKSISSGNRKIS